MHVSGGDEIWLIVYGKPRFCLYSPLSRFSCLRCVSKVFCILQYFLGYSLNYLEAYKLLYLLGNPLLIIDAPRRADIPTE